nr:MAG TPA: hypothetical protein [Caudoviricetes sp.]
MCYYKQIIKPYSISLVLLVCIHRFSVFFTTYLYITTYYQLNITRNSLVRKEYYIIT